MKGEKRQREEDREEERKDKTEKERREGGREEKEGKKRRTFPKSVFPVSVASACWLLSAGRYALHFKTHLGLQGRKQLASSNLSRLSILGDNEGQVLKGK